MKTVTILLSTFNGENYIVEQINSLYKQVDVQIWIVIRDDGSSDNTLNIINDYLRKYRNITLLTGQNVGATKSFGLLCKYVDSCNVKTDYYAFCDQDDIWMPDKLSRAISILDSMDNSTPKLYYSNLSMIDDRGNDMGLLLNNSIVRNTKRQSLAQIFAYGCTCVFNSHAVSKFCAAEVDNVIYHDNWMLMVCMFLGNTYYDRESFIKYRQHNNNLSGEKKRGIQLIIQRMKRLKNLKELGHPFENISKQLLELFYNELTTGDIALLRLISEYRNSSWNKAKLLFTGKISAGYVEKNIYIKIRVLINHV